MRCRNLNTAKEIKGSCVIYVMSRDQRVSDNAALQESQKYALEQKLPLLVVFRLSSDIKNRHQQQYDFMLKGLQEVERKLKTLNIPFLTHTPSFKQTFLEFLKTFKPSAIFFDFSPLRGARQLHSVVAERSPVPVFEVDTHNIIPVWEASQKQEWAAYTIRPKIHRVLQGYLREPEQVIKHPYTYQDKYNTDWDTIFRKFSHKRLDHYTVSFDSGETAALKTLNEFIKDKIIGYSEHRNDPTKDYQSNLSPYLHFGQISSLRVALNVKNLSGDFLEELIVRKELSDNFCFYNQNYDSFDGLPDWAKTTLEKHIKDTREHIFSLEQLAHAKTYDPAWNAAQTQLVTTGKMHGYMRMYWAKKILEWTESPQIAIEYAVHLNDTYHLDGHDPNGYVGILWSIGGLHDRPWFERKIFGTVRYMNLKGLQKKFNLDLYINRYNKII